MSAATIPIIFLAAVVIGVVIFLIKKFMSPKKLNSLEGLIKQGRASQAAKAAKLIVAKEPNNSAAHYLLGKAYLADNKPELALMELKTVNQLGDFSAACPEKDYRITIAQLYKNFNQPEEALKEYLLLIKLDPNNAEFYYQAGGLFEARNRADKASQYYQKAVQLDSKHSNAHFALGNLYYGQKKFTEAKEELEIALRFQQDNYKAYFIIGKILKESHNYVGALQAFEKAMRDPEYKLKALVERGGCYMSTGEFDKAVVELERVVSLSKNDSATETLYARYFLGYCFEKMRKLEPAIEQWEKIYAKKPGFKDVAEKLSQYQDLRQDDMMKEYLTCSKDDFVLLGGEVVKKMGLSIRDTGMIPNGCSIAAVESESKWAGTRRVAKLIWFLRLPDLISESVPRALLEEMKKQSLPRGIIFSSSNFSKTAQSFAESRPIDLYGKDKLQEMLQGIKIPPPPKK